MYVGLVIKPCYEQRSLYLQPLNTPIGIIYLLISRFLNAELKRKILELIAVSTFDYIIMIRYSYYCSIDKKKKKVF